ncbi:MAG: serine/threonine protein kinase [Myxococcota bacterium]|nr:serine/threonine protein kinase [Myxococcota bacterium]MDW8362654.1 serine/threonine-protein kinase [Myxococcales bacterium]
MSTAASSSATGIEVLARTCPSCGTPYDPRARFCQRDGAPLGPTVNAVRPPIGSGAAVDPILERTIVGRYHVEAVLGAGGMGTVYRARRLADGERVAVKILHPDLARDADALRRFHREARVASAIRHPNVVRVLDAGELPDGGAFLVMELVCGRTLLDELRAGPWPVRRAVHVAVQIAEGLGAAHALGVVHRDIKPENVMLVRAGPEGDLVKVLDFGVARLLDAATVATQAGLVFGTARYISPEGAAGEPTDARSDVYSVGVLLFQILTGRTPFTAATPVALLMKHLHEPPPDVRALAPAGSIPDPVADVVMQALDKRPDRRPRDGRCLAHALREAAVRAGLHDAGSTRVAGIDAFDPQPSSRPAPAMTESSQSPRHPPRRRAPARRAWLGALAAAALGAASSAWVVSRLLGGQGVASPSAPAKTREREATGSPPEARRLAPMPLRLRVSPERPRVGEPVLLLATGVEDGALTSRFELTGPDGATVSLPATAEAHTGVHAASVVFERAGEHAIAFPVRTADGREWLARLSVRVEPRPQPAAPRSVARRGARSNRRELREDPRPAPHVLPAESGGIEWESMTSRPNHVPDGTDVESGFVPRLESATPGWQVAPNAPDWL